MGAFALAQLVLQATAQGLRGSRRLYTIDDHRRIICPFLGALVNERKLAVKTLYHRDELRDITIAAGLDPAITEKHIQSNFKDIPSGLIDIFDMEGLPNEHWTSTGIHDCTTLFSNCRTHPDGHQVCDTSTPDKMCGTPNAAMFDNFFRLVDVNYNNVLTKAELANAESKVPFNDLNNIGEGTISASHQALIDIFGDNGQSITREALRTISLDRRFPANYVFSTDGFKTDNGCPQNMPTCYPGTHRCFQTGPIVDGGPGGDWGGNACNIDPATDPVPHHRSDRKCVYDIAPPTDDGPRTNNGCPQNMPTRYPGTHRCFQTGPSVNGGPGGHWGGRMCNIDPATDPAQHHRHDRKCVYAGH